MSRKIGDTMKKEYRRKHYFIDRGFQGRFILLFVLICSAGMFLSVSLFGLMASSGIEKLRWRMIIHADKLSEVVSPYLAYTSIFAIAFASLTVLALMKFLKWEMSRSIVELQNSLIKVNAGNLAVDVRLKEEYLFYDSSVELNVMVATLRARFHDIRESFNNIKGTIENLNEIKEGLIPEKCTQLISSSRGIKTKLQSG
jgi:methyl-accepting chemotaxis protein